MVCLPNRILVFLLGAVCWQAALGEDPKAVLTGPDDAVLVRTDPTIRQVKIVEERKHGKSITHSIAHIAAGGERAVKIKIPEGRPMDQLKILTSPVDVLPTDAFSQPVRKPGWVREDLPLPVKTEYSSPKRRVPVSAMAGNRTFFSDPQVGLRMVLQDDSGESRCFTRSLAGTPVRLHVREPRVFWSARDTGGTLAGSIGYNDSGFTSATSTELEGKWLASFLTDKYFVVITETTRDVESDVSPWKTGLLVHRLSLDENVNDIPPEFFVVPDVSHTHNRIVRSGGLTFLVTDTQTSAGLQSTLHTLDIGGVATESGHALLLSGYFRLKRGVRWLPSGALAVVSETWPPEIGEPQPLFVDVFSTDGEEDNNRVYPLHTLPIPVFEPLHSVHWEEETLFLTESPAAGPITVHLDEPMTTSWKLFLPKGPWLLQSVNSPYLLAIRNVNTRVEAKLFHVGSGRLLDEIALPEYGDATDLRILTAPGGFWIEEPGASYLGTMLTVRRRKLVASEPVHLSSPALAVWSNIYGGSSVATSERILKFQNDTMRLVSNSPVTGDSPPDGVVGAHVVSVNTDSTWETPSATVQSRELGNPDARTVTTMIGPGWLAGYLIDGSVLHTARYQQRLVKGDAGEELTGFLLFDRIDFSDTSPVKQSRYERRLHRLYQQPRLHAIPAGGRRILWTLPNQDRSQLEFILTRPESKPPVLSHYGISLPSGETLGNVRSGGCRLLAATLRRISKSRRETFVREISVSSDHKLALGRPVAVGGRLLAVAPSGGSGCFLCVRSGPDVIRAEYFDGVRSYALADGDLRASAGFQVVHDSGMLRIASFGGSGLQVASFGYTDGWKKDSSPITLARDGTATILRHHDHIIVAESLRAMRTIPLSSPGPPPDATAEIRWNERPLGISDIVSARGDDFVGSLDGTRDWATASLRPPKETFGAWVARQAWRKPSPTPEGDDDGDGFTNLAEYALGTDPAKTSSRPVFSIHTGSGGTVFRYVSNPAATGLNVRAEIASDLKNWRSSPSEGDVVTIPKGGDPHEPGYFRLRIHQNAEEDAVESGSKQR